MKGQDHGAGEDLAKLATPEDWRASRMIRTHDGNTIKTRDLPCPVGTPRKVSFPLSTALTGLV